jgi:nucleotide-binding universal stress UspA family protein
LTYHGVPQDYRIRRILIPTDFSASSRKSLDWGLALSEITGAEPVLLYVISRSGKPTGIAHEELSALAAEELERWCALVNPALPRPIRKASVMEASTPAEGILSFAAGEGADMIVMSATGSSIVRAVLLGANTRKVVRGSTCPVLVIPASNRVTAQGFLKKTEAKRREPVAEALAAGIS